MKKLLKWTGITIGLVILFLFFGVNNDDIADARTNNTSNKN